MPFLGVYGHVNVDYILQVQHLPRPDQTVPVERELIRLGGTGGNIARAAASLGVPCGLAACVGDDFPAHYRSQLQSAGIELTDLRSVPGPTPKIWILSSADGKQSAVIDQGVMGDGHERPRLDLTMLGADWVHFTTGPVADHLSVAQEAMGAGKRVTFDPGQELHYRYPERTFEKFLDQSDLFIANRGELKVALEKLGYGDPAQLLDHTDAVIETRGSEGSILYRGDEVLKAPACPVRSKTPPETTGAGDVFRAGLYAALHAKKPLTDAQRWGSAAASLFLESSTARFPSGAELADRLAKWHP